MSGCAYLEIPLRQYVYKLIRADTDRSRALYGTSKLHEMEALAEAQVRLNRVIDLAIAETKEEMEECGACAACLAELQEYAKARP